MKRLASPSTTAEPLHDPLNVVPAVDEPEFTMARYDPLIAIFSLPFAVTLEREIKRGF